MTRCPRRSRVGARLRAARASTASPDAPVDIRQETRHGSTRSFLLSFISSIHRVVHASTKVGCIEQRIGVKYFGPLTTVRAESFAADRESSHGLGMQGITVQSSRASKCVGRGTSHLREARSVPSEGLLCLHTCYREAGPSAQLLQRGWATLLSLRDAQALRSSPLSGVHGLPGEKFAQKVGLDRLGYRHVEQAGASFNHERTPDLMPRWRFPGTVGPASTTTTFSGSLCRDPGSACVLQHHHLNNGHCPSALNQTGIEARKTQQPQPASGMLWGWRTCSIRSNPSMPCT